MLNLASHLGYEPNESITPDTSFHQDDATESAKQGIEPKNLMGVIISSSASYIIFMVDVSSPDSPVSVKLYSMLSIHLCFGLPFLL